MGHTLVGTTDTPGKPTSEPTPPESDIRWILSEVEKYLDPSLRVRSVRARSVSVCGVVPLKKYVMLLRLA